MRLRHRPTLKQLFTLSLLGLIVSLSLIFYFIFAGSQTTILEISRRFRETKSKEIADWITKYLDEAPNAVTHIEKELEYGLLDPKDFLSVQKNLLSLLLENSHISEATFTYGQSMGFDADKERVLIPSSIEQVTVFRTLIKKSEADNSFESRHTWFEKNTFLCKSELWKKSGSKIVATQTTITPCVNPAEHLTFKTPARQDHEGQLLATDLHWSQLDEDLPENQRRVEVSVQKAINNSQGQFAGVLRVGLIKEEVDRTIRNITLTNHGDQHLIFLCDNQGRLITGFGENQKVVESGDDLRIEGDNLPTPVVLALKQASLKEITAQNPVANAEFRLGGKIYFCTFRALSEDTTQDWIVGIVVPRDYYLGNLLEIRRKIYLTSLFLGFGIVIVGALILRGVGRAHSLVLRETERMNAFEFSPSNSTSNLRDIEEVLTGLEKAKTAMRSMGKYVPVDLVRRMYHDGIEPVLGGNSADLSILFTDIKNFTQFAESATPERLAEVLGQYMEAMATVIQNEHGTIDKYIGDAVMAFWNAPEKLDSHSLFACHAALRCDAALKSLYTSPAWKDAPKFETRFGLHRGTASVGHFGSPDRFNYTAIGDSINLASRLEGLNKYYGTTIITSETIYSVAKDKFEFRLLDCVAVKGKTQGVTIYELLAEKTPDGQRSPHIVCYEEAYRAYLRKDFKIALSLLEKNPTDSPSLALAARCRNLIEESPSENWDGIHTFDTK
ncbi:MAG: adenylate/guanylate cyclase domain-containing protein [Chthoniobacterales bacterium]